MSLRQTDIKKRIAPGRERIRTNASKIQQLSVLLECVGSECKHNAYEPPICSIDGQCVWHCCSA